VELKHYFHGRVVGMNDVVDSLDITAHRVALDGAHFGPEVVQRIGDEAQVLHTFAEQRSPRQQVCIKPVEPEHAEERARRVDDGKIRDAVVEHAFERHADGLGLVEERKVGLIDRGRAHRGHAF